MKNSKVFISTGYYKNINPIETLDYFVKKKIYDIEFSGGLQIYKKDEKKFFNKLIKHNARLHNYFPPPKIKFVINLASKNKNILRKSINHVKKSIILSKKINANYFSFHAGFRVDPGLKVLEENLKRLRWSRKKFQKIFF